MTDDGSGDAGINPCCGEGPRSCVFGKALLAQAASCECAERVARGERLGVECSSPVARTNCGTLAALLHERSRFALKLPPASRPLLHQQALRLQCGGLQALRELLRAGFQEGPRDVHQLVQSAQGTHGSLTELPWGPLVSAIAAWRAPLRRKPAP
jgi:hypothetical protein